MVFSHRPAIVPLLVAASALASTACTAIGYGIGYAADRANGRLPLPDSAQHRARLVKGEETELVLYHGGELSGLLVEANENHVVLEVETEAPNDPPPGPAADSPKEGGEASRGCWSDDGRWVSASERLPDGGRGSCRRPPSTIRQRREVINGMIAEVRQPTSTYKTAFTVVGALLDVGIIVAIAVVASNASFGLSGSGGSW